MTYNLAQPTGFLSQYVKHYWSLDKRMPTGKAHLQKIVPNGLFELIIYFGDKPEVAAPQKVVSDNMVITGQLHGHHELKVTGHLSLFAIYFLPHGLSRFLALPMHELVNQSVPLRYILTDTVDQLEDELASATTFEKRIQVAERFLIGRLQRNDPTYQHDRIRQAVHLINQSKGRMPIEEVAARLFLSRKQFERTFAAGIGTSPKQFIKIVRFQHAIYEKSQQPALRLTALAHRCGYFDQSHMINDFKTLSGITPKSYFNSEEPFSDYFG